MKVFIYIKKILSRIFVLALCIIMLAQFSACATNKKTVQNGVEIMPHLNVTHVYSEDSKNFALTSISTFLTQVYTELSIPKNKFYNIPNHAISVRTIIENHNLTETSYRSTFSNLTENADAYAKSIAAIVKGSSVENPKQTAKSALAALSSIIGIDKTTSIVFDILVYYYDCEYQRHLSNYEEFKFPTSLQHANAAKNDKEILQNEITKSNFLPVIKLTLFLSKLFTGGAFDGPLLNSFSSGEILILLKAPNFSNLSITPNGWQYLLKLAAKFLSLTELQKSVFIKSVNNGDLLQVASNMQDAVKLICAVQNNLNEKSVSIINDGNSNALISQCFANFSEQEWALFEKITTLNFNNKEYNKEGADWYDIDGKTVYNEYLKSLPTITLNDLKAAANSDDGEQFTDLLKNYFAGICPAFFYGASV